MLTMRTIFNRRLFQVDTRIQSQSRELGVETLEAREMPASAASLGRALGDSLRSLAAQSTVPTATGKLTGDYLQRDILAAAAPAVEAGIDRTLRSAADLMTQAERTNALPPMTAGYQINLNPGGGKAARLTIDRSTNEKLSTPLADDRTGWADLDRTFAGKLTGQANGTTQATLKLILDVTEASDGRLTVSQGRDSRLEISGVDANFTLSGRGKFGELNDVSLSTDGKVTGQATIQLDGQPNALRSSATLDMKATAITKLLSNDETTRGVSWSVRDESRAIGNQVRASASQFTSPKAIDLLKAAVRQLNGYRVSIPDGVMGGVQKVLDVKVPFTGKTLGEQIKFPTMIPVAINTVNPDKFDSFTALAQALATDKRVTVLLQGEGGAAQFAQGKKVALLSATAKLEYSPKDITLAETLKATYPVLPGVTLTGKASLYGSLKGTFEALLVVDARGLGFGEGTNTTLALRLTGELKGEVNVLEITKKFSLINGSAKAEAFVEGAVAVTLGRPLNSDGKPTGTGVLYVGTAAVANPPRHTLM